MESLEKLHLQVEIILIHLYAMLVKSYLSRCSGSLESKSARNRWLWLNPPQAPFISIVYAGALSFSTRG